MHRITQLGATIACVAALTACTSQATTTTAGGAAVSDSGKVCINTQLIKKQTVLTDQDIQFEMNNGDVWVNHLPRRCPSLKAEGGFAWALHNSSACSNQEIIHVLNDGGTCTIGEFTKQPPKP